jgi:hypothetical protein
MILTGEKRGAWRGGGGGGEQSRWHTVRQKYRTNWPGVDSGLRGKGPVIDRLKHGTAYNTYFHISCTT